MDQSISLNKFISDTGYCSRREADNLITQGRVLLNDRPAVLGNRYKPGDTVEVDGSLITAAKKEKRVYLALNKPRGITTTTELHIKDNIITFVGYPQRIFPIGRLDKDSEGLIFLTNDGDIINKILRAGNNHEKEYIVRVNKAIDTAFVQQMSQGVPILDTKTLPCKVQSTGRQTFRITLTQGLNRQIRRMCEYLGYEVVSLQRTRIMNVSLDKLALGKWRHLTETEVAKLKESVAESSKEGKPARARKVKGEVNVGEDEVFVDDRSRVGKERDGHGRDGRSRVGKERDGHGRDGKVREGKERDSKPQVRDGKPPARDGKSRDGKPQGRDGKTKDTRPPSRDSKSQTGRNKDSKPQPGKTRDAKSPSKDNKSQTGKNKDAKPQSGKAPQKYSDFRKKGKSEKRGGKR